MWDVVVHDSAVHELRQFKKRDQQTFKTIVNCLTELSKMPDPRKSPKVASLDFDAPGWYRLKITYPHQVRVIFRLLDNDKIEIGKYARIDCEEDEKKFIQVTRVANRDKAYAHPLHNRYFSVLQEAV